MLIEPKAIEAVLPATTTDDPRYSINGIRLEQGKAIATDGHRLHVVTWKAECPEGEFPKIEGCDPNGGPELEPCIIPKDAAVRIPKMPPKKPALPCLRMVACDTRETNANGTVRIAATDLECPQVSNIVKLEGNFPTYEKVIPEPNAAIATFYVNPAYLIDACRAAMKMHGASKHYVKPIKVSVFGQPADGKPIRIDADTQHGDFLAVIMPMNP